MTINEAIGSLIATLSFFWHIIAFIVIVVVLLDCLCSCSECKELALQEWF